MSGRRTGDGKAGVVGVGVVALLVLLMGWGVWSAVRPDITTPTTEGPSQGEGPRRRARGPRTGFGCCHRGEPRPRRRPVADEYS